MGDISGRATIAEVDTVQRVLTRSVRVPLAECRTVLRFARGRGGESMSEGGTVLVAEDDRDQREILSEVLEYEGFKVITAASPKQLVERLTPEIDLVLLDVNGV